MKTILRITITILSLAFLVSCGGDSGGGDTTPNPVGNNGGNNNGGNNGGGNSNGGNSGGTVEVIPDAPQLEYPLKDELCTTGIFIESGISTVEFLWKTTKNATSYTLTIKDQSSSNPAADIIVSDITTIKADVNIKQNTQYKWTVEAKSRTGQTAISDEWLMYNAAEGVQNYAPFPAELTSPENAVTVVNLTPTIEWTGSDVDNDIKEYEILLDTINPPVTSDSVVGKDISQKTLSGLIAATTYYWQIITTDNFGNVTKSQVKEFTTP